MTIYNSHFTCQNVKVFSTENILLPVLNFVGSRVGNADAMNEKLALEPV